MRDFIFTVHGNHEPKGEPEDAVSFFLRNWKSKSRFEVWKTGYQPAAAVDPPRLADYEGRPATCENFVDWGAGGPASRQVWRMSFTNNIDFKLGM